MNLRQGDIVVLGLEYELYLYDGRVSKVCANYITTRDVDYFRKLPLIEKIKTIFSFSTGELLVRCGFLPRIEKRRYYSSTNKWGDLTDNTVLNQKDVHRQELARTTPFDFELGFKARGWREVEMFINEMHQRGVLVLATYPTTMYFPEYETVEYQGFFNQVKLFYEKLGVPVLGTPEMLMFPREGFYNTIYHALDTTKFESTDRLAALLEEKLEELTVPRGTSDIKKASE
jgi:hypothetical protein